MTVRRSMAMVFALTLPLAAGCVSPPPVGTAEVTLFDERHMAFPGGATGFAIYVNNTFAEAQTFGLTGIDALWRPALEPEKLDLGPGGGGVFLLTLRPRQDARPEIHRLTATVSSDSGFAGTIAWSVEVSQLSGSPAAEGKGARVYTAGFYDNGTLFYTNDRAIDATDGLVKAYLGGDDLNFSELKVYVGGKRGTPPPEPYSSAGYVPVIKGFNDRLIGMYSGETMVVHIPPERAYTLPGDEEHVLYGYALNFIIRVSGVDDLQMSSPVPI